MYQISLKVIPLLLLILVDKNFGNPSLRYISDLHVTKFNDKSSASVNEDYFAKNLPRRPPIQPRIIGGSDVYQGEKPFQLWWTYGSYPFNCGASLVEVYGIQFAITAAHCTWSGYPTQKSTINPSTIVVTAGDVRINDFTGNEDRRYVTKIVQHEDYDPSFIVNDISLLFFDEDFPLGPNIDTIDLPSKPSMPLPSKVEISGWGSEDPHWNLLNVMQKVEVPVMPQDVCLHYDRGQNRLSDKQFCTGSIGVGNVGPCSGDSGGPVVTLGPRPILVGVVSFGPGEVCGSPYYPSVFLRVSKYLDWIKEKISDHIQASLG